MAKEFYQPVYWGDYQKDTVELDLAEHGAYLNLMGLYWQNKGPLPDNIARLQRYMRQERKPDGKIIRKILELYFTLKDGAWHHKRIDRDIANMAHYQTTQQVKGQKSADARRAKKDAPPENDLTTVATVVTTDVPTEPPTGEQPEGGEAKAKAKARKGTNVPSKNIRGPAASPGCLRFEEFWHAYPDGQAHNKKRCQESWRVKNLDAQADTVLAALERWKASDGWGRGYIPWAQKFLSGEYWLTAPKGRNVGGMGGMAGAGIGLLTQNQGAKK